MGDPTGFSAVPRQPAPAPDLWARAGDTQEPDMLGMIVLGAQAVLQEAQLREIGFNLVGPRIRVRLFPLHTDPH